MSLIIFYLHGRIKTLEIEDYILFNIHVPKGFVPFKINRETSLVVQWLRLHASTAGGTRLIPGQKTKTLHAVQCGPPRHNTIKIKRLIGNSLVVQQLGLYFRC